MADLLEAIKQALMQQQQQQQPPPMSMMPNMPQANGTPPFVPSNRPMPIQNPMPQGQGDQGSGFGEFLRTLGLPLVSTAVGLASPKMLPGAAGFNQGYPAGRQQAFENKITKREQDRRDSVSSGLSEAPQGFEVVGYDQKGQPMIRKPKRDIQSEKFDSEQQQKEQDNRIKADLVKNRTEDTLKTLDEVQNGIDYFGFFGQVPSIPGTDRYNWETNVNNLLSNKVIEVMTKLKEASKTGATGFGQLSNKELIVLQDASTSLKRGTSPEKAKEYLNIMRQSLQKVLSNDSNGSNENSNGGGNEFSSMSDEELRKIAGGQ